MSGFEFFVIGILGGISPGPITSLVLGETLKGGIRNGLKVPVALLFSNLIVAPVSVLILFMGSHIDGVLQLVTFTGAFVLIFMGFREWKSSGELSPNTNSQAFRKAFLADLINPHPYIFWFSVLAPSLVILLRRGQFTYVFLYWGLFLVGLLGTKSLLVLFTHQFQKMMTPSRMSIVLKVLAVSLIIFGFRLLI